MNDRLFMFILSLILIVFHVGFLLDGSWGWLWLGWMVALGWVSMWAAPVAIRLKSPKAIGKGFQSSIGPGARRCELPAQVDKEKRVIWPACELWSLGGGLGLGLELGGLGIFVICRRGLAIETTESTTGKANVFFNGHAEIVNRPDFIKYNILGTVRPHNMDPRLLIPPSWQTPLTEDDDWNWNTSRVIFIDVPVHPYIRMDEIGEFEIHQANAGSPVLLKDLIKGINTFRPDTVFLDLMHRFNDIVSTENKALRDSQAYAVNAERSRSRHYSGILAEITDVQDRMNGGLLQPVVDSLTSEEESAGGGRQ